MSAMKTPLGDDLLDALRDMAGPTLSLGFPRARPVEERVTTDVDDKERTLTIHVRACGFTPSNVSVVLEGAMLKVLVRRCDERVERAFHLSAALELEKMQVTLRGSVLTVRVPKRPAVPRIVPIHVDD